MRKKVLTVCLAIVLIMLIGTCALLLSNHSSKISLEEAERILVERLPDSYDYDFKVNQPIEEEIYINDRQVFRYEMAYNFGTFYNENVPGLEGRWAGDYAVSFDGKKVYWYDPVNNWHVDCDDLRMYDMGTGGWTEN